MLTKSLWLNYSIYLFHCFASNKPWVTALQWYLPHAFLPKNLLNHVKITIKHCLVSHTLSKFLLCLVSGNHSGCGVPSHVLHRQWWRALAGRPLRVHSHEIWLEHHRIYLNHQKILSEKTKTRSICSCFLFLLHLRCFWRLHLPNHCSSDASLHRLQQKEGGGCLEAPSGTLRPMMWLFGWISCISYCQHSCIQSAPCCSNRTVRSFWRQVERACLSSRRAASRSDEALSFLCNVIYIYKVQARTACVLFQI